MDPIKQFEAERQQRITALGEDREMQALSSQWLQMSMAKMYVYNFSWLGRPIIQYPQDIVGFQEVVWDVKPDLIIECGIAHGGSLMLSASLLALIDFCEAAQSGASITPSASKRKVIGVDIDIRSHNREAIESHPLGGMIEMVQGSSIDPETVAQVHRLAEGYERVLVCLDSMHTHDHVVGELEAYAPLVTPGSYCVVFDTFVEDMPPKFFPDRPWNVGDNPKTAVWEYLKAHPEFEIDADVHNKLQVTVAPDGYLKRLR